MQLCPLLLLPLLSPLCVLGQSPRALGDMAMTLPGFSVVYESSGATDPRERYSLVVSTFSVLPGTVDDVNIVRHPGKYLSDPASAPTESIGKYVWPREPGQIPAEVFGFEQAVAVPGGFLLFGKTNGAVTLADLRSDPNVTNTDISSGSNDEPENEWFYHRVMWRDADGDGDLDAFTCRCRQELLPEAYYSSLMWYENPGGPDAINMQPWNIGLRISDNDCDTFMREARLSAGGQEYDVIFTVGYFMNKFSVYWSEHPQGLWNDPAFIRSRLIDTLVDDADCTDLGAYYCGHFFDLEVSDLNQDGRLDLLVSINSEVYGHLVGYEIPDDFRTGNYTTHTLAEGFFPSSDAEGSGSPGQPQEFYPTVNTTGKPWLLVSGDDDGRSYILEPLTQDPDDWSYNMTAFVEQGEGQIVGRPTAFDANGDGYSELFVPAYTAGLIKFFTFAP